MSSSYPADPTADFGTDILLVLSTDDEGTAANELRTMLELDDRSFSVADSLQSGKASDMGDNFVASTRTEITKECGNVDALLGLTDEPTGLSGLLTIAWSWVQTQVKSVCEARWAHPSLPYRAVRTHLATTGT